MRLRFTRHPTDKKFPYRIQLLDFASELARFAIPPVRSVESGRKKQPELKVMLAREVVDGYERIIPDGVVQIEKEAYQTKHKSLDTKLIFQGLRETLADIGVKEAARTYGGQSGELAIAVKLLDASVIDGALPLRGEEAMEGDQFHPDETDRRGIIDRQIRERRGSRTFRDGLRKKYGNRCMVSGCSLLEVLEAAHINPYRGEADNHWANGLLLRSDIHTLFDLDLIGIEPEHLIIELHPDIRQEYRSIIAPKLLNDSDHRPSLEALRIRYSRFRERVAAAKT